LVLRGRRGTSAGRGIAGRHARRPVLRSGFQTLGTPVHDGRADRSRRRAPADERPVHVRGRRVRAGHDAAARGRPPRPEVPVSDRADRLLRAAVPDRGHPPDARVPRVDRPVRPVLLVDEPPPADGQDHRHRVPVAEAHGPAGHQPAQASHHHHAHVSAKRTDRIFTTISV